MTSFTLTDLDIIGFASILETPTLPRLLAPVFRERASTDFVLLPPFTLQFNEVFNVTQTNTAGLEALVAQEKLTLLQPPIAAQTNHDLWVNPEGQVAYAPKAEVKKAFIDLFEKHLALAEAGLAARSYEAACQHAAIARAVNPGHLAPLIIRATAERSLGLLAPFAFTRHIAKDIVTSAEFDRLIKDRTGGVTFANSLGLDGTSSTNNKSSSHGSDVMRSMVLIRSQYSRRVA